MRTWEPLCTLAIQKTGIPINTKSAKRKLRAYGIVIERVRAGNGTAEESGKTVRRRSRNKIIITDDADALHDRGTYHCSGVDKVLEKFTEVKEDIYEKRIERLIFRRGWNWYGRDDLNLSRVNCPGNNFQESAYDACW